MCKSDFYNSLLKQADCLVKGEINTIANMANLSALLFQSLKDVNWAGFYLVDSPSELVLGPFQGKPACIRIPFGKGVCGTAFDKKEAQLVKDVHSFEGHIACDADSESEVVIPVFKDNQLFAVLDIDSPILNRFDEQDKNGLELVVKCLEATL